MGVFVICACTPQLVGLYVRPPGDDDFRFLGELRANGIRSPCALAAIADNLVRELGWERELPPAPPSDVAHERARADYREMTRRVDQIMRTLTSSTEPLLAKGNGPGAGSDP
jgi:hypothetical protein